MATIDNKNFAYDEMMTHIPLCSHNNIKKVLIVGEISEEFEIEIDKHKIEEVVYTNELNIDDTFDIILYNKQVKSQEELILLDRLLEPSKGILCTQSIGVRKDIESFKENLKLIANRFWITMPFSFGHTTLIFASKKFHPQANIVLQVSDMLEDCNYYNTELHNAAFVFPTYITKALTGIAKR